MKALEGSHHGGSVVRGESERPSGIRESENDHAARSHTCGSRMPDRPAHDAGNASGNEHANLFCTNILRHVVHSTTRSARIRVPPGGMRRVRRTAVIPPG